jgi:hypothetical protein
MLENFNAIGTDLQSGANLGDLRRLLKDLDVPAGQAQAYGGA